MISLKQTYERLLPIYNAMDKSIKVSSVVDLTGGYYKLNTTKTKWAMLNHKVTILGNDYKITDFDFNNYITVYGTTPITSLTTFNLNPFKFKHGTMRVVNNEQSFKNTDFDNRLPLMWLKGVVDERADLNPNSSVDDNRIELYFIGERNPSWTQEEGDGKIIYPLRAGLNEFLKAMDTAQGFIPVDGIANIRNYNVFGTFSDAGMEKSIFGEPLAAVSYENTISLLKECDC